MPASEKTTVGSAIASRLRNPISRLLDEDVPVIEIDIATIKPNPYQPRKTVNDASIAELATSIEQKGLLQPIVVTKDDAGGHILAVGQRRLLAHKKLERTTILAIVSDGDPEELALIENLQREDLLPLEEAEALASLQERHSYTLAQLGEVIGKAKSTLSETLSLTKLPDTIKDAARKSQRPVSKSVLLEISKAPSIDRQMELWEEAEKGATVREARAQKGSRNVRPPTLRMLSAAELFAKRLQKIDVAEITKADQPAQALIALRDDLVEVVDQILKQRPELAPAKTGR